jgi:CHAT domain-containing protein
MNERPTILQGYKLGSTSFRFQITKPDQVLAPIMEVADVEIRPDSVQKLCRELATTIERQSRQRISHQAQNRIVNLGKALYRQILPVPTQERLRAVLSGDFLPLLISTEVPEIPWELLHDGQDFLGLKYAIGRQLLKSTGIPVATPWQGDRMQCLLIADPSNDLPEARKEAITLKQWLTQRGIECDLLLGDEASSTEIIIRLSSDDYNFIHYSGHIGTDHTTHAPSLMLSDLQLSSTEIERAISHNGPVVILNGCDSASVEGLANAFLKSGAQLVVGTLFDVPDLGARHWAEVFYQGLISGQPAGEALRLARRAMLDIPECSTAWLSFVMYGDPCLRLIWSKGASTSEATPLDRVLQTIELRRHDFDNACLNVLEGSLKYAREIGGVSSANLFTAMLEGSDNRLRDYLQACKVDAAEMRKMFDKSGRFAELLVQTGLSEKEADIRLSDSVRHVLQDAHNRARHAKRSQATFDDLLVAFSQRRNSGVNLLLQLMEVDLQDMVRSLGIEPSPAVPAKSQESPRVPTGTAPPVSIAAPKPEPLFHTRGAKSTGPKPPLRQPKQTPRSEPHIVQRFADVVFPASVAKTQWQVLRIQILASRRDERNLPIDVEMAGPEDQPAKIVVCVHAPDFEAREALQRTIDVPSTNNSESIGFHLCAQRAGSYTIQVDFMQQDRYIGTTSLEVEVVESGRGTREGKAHITGQPTIGQTGAPPDLTVLIGQQPLETGEHRLKFVLLSPLIEAGLYYRDAGESKLARSPVEWVEHVLKQVQELALEDDSTMAERRLKSIGNTLWDELIPETLKHIYWRVRDKIRTVLIVTDDAWIPWEMIRPYRQTDQGIEEDDFLCQTFSLARWLRGAPALPHITVSESRIVGAGADSSQHFATLPSVQSEVSALESLLGKAGVRTISLESSRMRLVEAFEAGGFHHLHIACHGSASPKGGDLATIILGDGSLSPIDVSGPAMWWGRDRPFVFLNACETGLLGTSLTRLGGWAERFIASGCSAFVGTLWPVSDNLAKRFARVFYDQICQGIPLGEACWRARSDIRERGDSTWLAYCLYADPKAEFVLPAVPTSSAASNHDKVSEIPAEPIRQTGQSSRHIESVDTTEGNSRHLKVGEIPESDAGLDKDIYAPAVIQTIQYSAQRAIETQAPFIDSTLFFEALLQVGGAAAQAFDRLNIPAQQIVQELREINNSITPAQEPLTKEVGLSRSVAKILNIAKHLSDQTSHHQVEASDVLEAFILHNQNGVIRLLAKSGLEPDLLLNGAFQESGALNDKRFSTTARSILEEAIRQAQRSRMLGSPQILAALVARKDGLAREKLRVRGGDLDAHVQTLLSNIAIYKDRPPPNAVSLDACSTRARRILNLAEVLARFDGILAGEEHLLIAYVRCIQGSS